MDEDKKVTPLKALQGVIWREGYATGELEAHLYPDAVAAIRTWAKRGLRVYIYSSGSVEAQKLYATNSVAGDLRPLIDGYFDTTTGPKGDPDSYRKIAAAIGVPPGDIAFFSDAAAETDAALAAGAVAYRVDRTKPVSFLGEIGTTPLIGGFTAIVDRIA
jgi:enolase-phosphatase E1